MSSVIQLEELRCLGCGRLTNPSLPHDHELATREQASGAYVLCTACELQARRERKRRVCHHITIDELRPAVVVGLFRCPQCWERGERSEHHQASPTSTAPRCAACSAWMAPVHGGLVVTEPPKEEL